MIAAEPTRYHTGRKPRAGRLRCCYYSSLALLLGCGGGRALWFGASTYLVLHGVVTGGWGHILRHPEQTCWAKHDHFVRALEGDNEHKARFRDALRRSKSMAVTGLVGFAAPRN